MPKYQKTPSQTYLKFPIRAVRRMAATYGDEYGECASNYAQDRGIARNRSISENLERCAALK